MNSIPELFAAWISLAAAYEGGSIPMNPPAEPVDLARVEQVTGHTLPEDVRALYFSANGQIDPEDEGGSSSLHHVSDDPRLAGLRRWYLAQVDTQKRTVEYALEMTLAPWLFADVRPQHARFVENYPMHLAANIGAVEACPGERRTNMADMSLGIQLTHDWLLESGRISEQKHEELEAIRLNREDARQRLLTRGQRKQHTGDSGCTYSLSWTVEESTHSVQVIAYFR